MSKPFAALESRLDFSPSLSLSKIPKDRLGKMNHANGILLARRRREVNWALRHLGRTESSGAYDAQGQTATLSATRPLAVA